MTEARVIARESLSEPMRAMLLVVRWAKRPGHVGHPRSPSLRALERRGLVASRVDPTVPFVSIWTITQAGRALITADHAARR